MADNSIQRLLRYYYLKLKSFFFSKDVLSFLLFLILSAGIWFLNVLDKDRDTVISVPVVYKNLPRNISFENDLPREITLNIKDEGLNLLRYNKEKSLKLVFDISDDDLKNNELFFSHDKIIEKISAQLLNSTRIEDIFPAEIKRDYTILHAKVVPIKPRISILTSNQFMLTSPLKIYPEKIKIYGPEDILKKTNAVFTENFQLTNVRDTIIKNIRLSKLEKVKFELDDVQLSVFVEMFTEKKIALPVKVINAPVSLNVKTFPAQVEVIFNVGVSYFKAFKNTDIQLFIDYNDIKNRNLNKQKIKILNNNTRISNIRVIPGEVEFVLEGK